MQNLDYIVLHGCPPNQNEMIPPEKRWMTWIANQLTTKGFNAVSPTLPHSWNPKYKDWKIFLSRYSLSEETTFIGHSCSCAFLVRWLLESKIKAKKLVLVAPAKISKRKLDIYDFDLPKDGSHIADETVIYISNDEDKVLKSVDLYQKSLKARIIKLENKGHFHIYSMGRVEFPELLKELLD